MTRLLWAGLCLSCAAFADEAIARRHTYRDEGDGRAVAHIAVRLELTPAGATVRIELDCRGPDIDPALGAEGVRGENLVTAAEFTRLLVAGRHAVETWRDGAAQPLRAGAFAPLARGPLVRRQLDATRGPFEERAVDSLVRMRCLMCHPPEPGRYRTVVRVSERERFAVLWRVDTGGAIALDWVGQLAPEMLR